MRALDREETKTKNSKIEDLCISEKQVYELGNYKLTAYSNQKEKVPGEQDPESQKIKCGLS